MKIAYITRARMPTEKAHGLQIAKMCEAYVKLGHDIELIVPFRRNSITETVSGYYGLTVDFPIRTISIPDTILFSRRVPSLAYWLQAVLFLLRLSAHTIAKDTLIMTRSFDVAWWYTLRGYQVVCELHEWPRSHRWFSVFLLKKVQHLVCNSKGLAEEISKHGLMRPLVAPNGVDLDALKPTVSKTEMRTQCGIRGDEFVAMYIGALEDWKGYMTFLEASRKNESVTFVVVGGKEDHIKTLQEKYPKVRFLGTKPYRDIGNYQGMADVLVIPNDPAFTEAQQYTSPIKLFAHLASGVPIVVTDLKTIRDIVNEDEVFFFDGRADSLVQVIGEIQKNQAGAKCRAENASKKALMYTWTSRAENIIGTIS